MIDVVDDVLDDVHKEGEGCIGQDLDDDEIDDDLEPTLHIACGLGEEIKYDEYGCQSEQQPNEELGQDNEKRGVAYEQGHGDEEYGTDEPWAGIGNAARLKKGIGCCFSRIPNGLKARFALDRLN